MAVISIDDIKSDMSLDGDVKDKNGRILLTSGTVLTEKHISIMKMWGVTEANILNVRQEDLEAQFLAQIDSYIMEEAQEKINSLFKLNSKNDEFIDQLIRICTIRLAHKLETRGKK